MTEDGAEIKDAGSAEDTAAAATEQKEAAEAVVDASASASASPSRATGEAKPSPSPSPALASASTDAAAAAPSFSFLPLSPVRLSSFDIARKLHLDSTQLCISGDKGYRTCRATHGLSSGSLYFELRFLPLTSPSPSSADDPAAVTAAVRVGFSTLQADIDGCVGMDRWGYGFSSRGWRGHDAVWEEWQGGPWQPGDVIGVWLQLGGDEEKRAERRAERKEQQARDERRSKTAKSRKGYRRTAEPEQQTEAKETVRSRETDTAAAAADIAACSSSSSSSLPASSISPAPLVPTPSPSLPVDSAAPLSLDPALSALLTQQKAAIFFLGSSLSFFRNGRLLGAAFTDLYRGTYYPSVSLYFKARAVLCFGPNFACLPPEVGGSYWPPREQDGEEEREELAARGLLRTTGEGVGGGLVENSRHKEKEREKEREKAEEERDKERRARERERDKEREREREREKEKEKAAGEKGSHREKGAAQRDRDRDGSNSTAGAGRRAVANV